MKKKISQYISLILRHKPEVINIKLNKNGWANVNELISGIQKTYPNFDFEMLDDIVKTDNKQRYSFNDDKTLIRANQGHSINVDVELTKAIPPEILYHGTAKKYVDSIDKGGLISKNRLYVHLSVDVETASNVGTRHGELVIYEINTKKMIEDGYEFFISANGVWLTKQVPVKYLIKKGE